VIFELVAASAAADFDGDMTGMAAIPHCGRDK
jgi:hypothetical protein